MLIFLLNSGVIRFEQLITENVIIIQGRVHFLGWQWQVCARWNGGVASGLLFEMSIFLTSESGRYASTRWLPSNGTSGGCLRWVAATWREEPRGGPRGGLVFLPWVWISAPPHGRSVHFSVTSYWMIGWICEFAYIRCCHTQKNGTCDFFGPVREAPCA